ncbi:MAG TPA: hypothetical protein VK466_15550, partial [Terriglobales bacterium]|nr:hypothetical protein [Terriglobales bacterium]
QEVFRTLQPGAYLEKEHLKLRGWFLNDSRKRYILMRVDLRGGDPFPVAYHEYAHLVLDEVSDAMPLWLDEGQAEFYGKTKIRYETVVLGEPNQYYLALLRKEKRLPLATLFAIDETSPYYIEKNRGSIFYAESWALTQYLTLKDHEEKTARIGQYRKLVSEGVDPVTAGIRAFGDLKKLEKGLDFYIQQQSFNRLETTSVAKVDESGFEAQSIPAREAEAVEADLLACSGRLEEARVLVDRVLKQDPDNVSAQGTLALLAAANEAQAESRLRSEIRAEPGSASAHDRLAEFLWKHGRDLEEAKGLASRAVSLDAYNVGYRIHLADILLSNGDVELAIETLRRAAMVAKTSEEIATVDQRLKDVTAYAAVLVADDGAKGKTTTPANGTSQPERTDKRDPVPNGPHRFVTGVLKAVHCEPPALDLTVTSRTETVTLHSDNYYQIQFTALFPPTRDLQPCHDLEDKPARVEYIEWSKGGHTPWLIAVELHK